MIKDCKWFIAGAAMAAVFSGGAHATEQGAISYPLGVNTFMGGAYPMPGDTWFENYSQVYHSGSFKDGKGEDSVPGFGATAEVDSLRFLHSWKASIGPFGLTSIIAVPVVNANVRSFAGSQTRFGVSNVAVDPLDLTWSALGGSLFGYIGTIVFVPTGSPVSNPYYSFVPWTSATWFPNRRLDISLTLGVEFHTPNTKTNYRSGTVAFLEYGADYRPIDAMPKLTIGFGGYAAKQVSDDEISGTTVPGGFRQQVFAIGPQISYGGPTSGVALKWQHEFGAKNRTSGDRIWLQFLIPI